MLAIDTVEKANWAEFVPAAGPDNDFGVAPVTNVIENFYMTNAIARASETMAQCTEELGVSESKATGTDG